MSSWVSPLIRRDTRLVQQRPSDFVETAQQQLAAVWISAEPRLESAIVRDELLLEIDRQFMDSAFGAPDQRIHLRCRQAYRQKTVAITVRGEDVREGWRDDGTESVFGERPHGVLARRPATEVRTGHQNRRALRRRTVELEAGVGRAVGPVTPIAEQRGPEAGPLDAFQKLLGDDLIGIDVAPRQRDQASPVFREGLHHPRTSTRWPSMAAAAAIIGLMRCVRPPRPWRPSKLRFDVAAQRSPAPRTSSFMPRHIEHPALRHSKPAARNTWSRPSCSACAFTRCEPGTTIARTCGATWRPRTTPAAARRSSIRALVQEPRNTRSMGIPARGVPGASPMYCRARCAASRSASVASSAGSGTRAVMSATMPGVVPQVTCGPTLEASSTTTAS